MEENKDLEEMQMLEQQMNNLLMQKQSFQIEFTETQAALKEVESSSDEVYKIVGQLMIKTDKEKMKEELSNKEKILDLRIKSLEKQEGSFMEKLTELREKVMKTMKTN
jgi:prefoldin beta subunit